MDFQISTMASGAYVTYGNPSGLNSNPILGNGVQGLPTSDGFDFDLDPWGGYDPYADAHHTLPFAAANIKGGIVLYAQQSNENGDDGGGGILPPPPGWLDPDAALPVGDPVLPMMLFAVMCVLAVRKKLNKIRKSENN